MAGQHGAGIFHARAAFDGGLKQVPELGRDIQHGRERERLPCGLGDMEQEIAAGGERIASGDHRPRREQRAEDGGHGTFPRLPRGKPGCELAPAKRAADVERGDVAGPDRDHKEEHERGAILLFPQQRDEGEWVRDPKQAEEALRGVRQHLHERGAKAVPSEQGEGEEADDGELRLDREVGDADQKQGRGGDRHPRDRDAQACAVKASADRGELQEFVGGELRHERGGHGDHPEIAEEDEGEDSSDQNKGGEDAFHCSSEDTSAPYSGDASRLADGQHRLAISPYTLSRTRGPQMRTIGLIGGMSWESTAKYYRWINDSIKARLGGLHSAKCILLSVDFAEIEELQRSGDWDELSRVMVDSARRLEAAGAEIVLICTNTMHKVAGAVETAVRIPLLHIADATADAVLAEGLDTVGLLGTRFVMTEPFLRERFEARGVQVLLPAPERRAEVDRMIFAELCRGELRDESRAFLLSAMQEMRGRGAQGTILGCTEFGLLIAKEDAPMPIFDTAALHAEAAVRWALRSSDAQA